MKLDEECHVGYDIIKLFHRLVILSYCIDQETIKRIPSSKINVMCFDASTLFEIKHPISCQVNFDVGVRF